MPKLIEYPRASLKASLDLAKNVSELGGGAKIATVAEKMGLKVSGAFAALIGAAAKFSLVTSSSGVLSTTPLYREYKLAYTENDANEVLKRAFLAVPLFQKVHQKFYGQKLPIEILDKLIAREFEVDEGIASRVATYLTDAARAAKLLDEQNVFTMVPEGPPQAGENDPEKPSRPDLRESQSNDISNFEDSKGQHYVVQFFGPGMDSKISIREAEDLEIVEATLRKIKRKMGEAGETSPI